MYMPVWPVAMNAAESVPRPRQISSAVVIFPAAQSDATVSSTFAVRFAASPVATRSTT